MKPEPKVYEPATPLDIKRWLREIERNPEQVPQDRINCAFAAALLYLMRKLP